MCPSLFSQRNFALQERKRLLIKRKPLQDSLTKQNKIDLLERSTHTEKTFTSIENSLTFDDDDDDERKNSLVKSIEVPYSWEEPKSVLKSRIVEIHRRYSPNHQEAELQKSNHGLTIVNPTLIPHHALLHVRKRLQRYNSSSSLSSLGSITSMTSSVSNKNNDCLQGMNISDIIFDECEDFDNSLTLLTAKLSENEAHNVVDWGYFVDVVSEEVQQPHRRRFMSKELSHSARRPPLYLKRA